jgi:hypothetical protein
MAKPDSNFVYYITEKGRRNKSWKCIRVTHAPCYVRKGPVLPQKRTRARRRRQYREWTQCLVRQLIGKQRHVTKLVHHLLFNDVWMQRLWSIQRAVHVHTYIVVAHCNTGTASSAAVRQQGWTADSCKAWLNFLSFLFKMVKLNSSLGPVAQ